MTTPLNLTRPAARPQGAAVLPRAQATPRAPAARINQVLQSSHAPAQLPLFPGPRSAR